MTTRSTALSSVFDRLYACSIICGSSLSLVMAPLYPLARAGSIVFPTRGESGGSGWAALECAAIKKEKCPERE
jgi:hypothetical protein